MYSEGVSASFLCNFVSLIDISDLILLYLKRRRLHMSRALVLCVLHYHVLSIYY